METKLRIRVGNAEVEVSGEEEFVTTRLPGLVSDLLCRLAADCPPVKTPPAPTDTPSTDPKLASIAGDVRDYWTDTPVPGAQVATIGLTPDLTSRSDEAGRFIMAGRSAGSRCSLLVSGADGYVETTVPVELSSGPTTLSAIAIAAPDINRQHALLGIAREPETATIIVELLDGAGGPLQMVPLSDITLTTANGLAIGGGPYFFGANRDVQPQADMPISHAFDKRARAAFINVPKGDHTLQVTGTGTGEALTRVTVGVRAAGGATVVRAQLPA